MSAQPEYTPDELKEMPNGELVGLVRACAIGCSDRTIARILKEAAARLNQQDALASRRNEP
jgi:hypothetical protein